MEQFKLNRFLHIFPKLSQIRSTCIPKFEFLVNFNAPSRVYVCVTNNNGFWIAWWDLLTPSFTISLNHSQLQYYNKWQSKSRSLLVSLYSDLNTDWRHSDPNGRLYSASVSICILMAVTMNSSTILLDVTPSNPLDAFCLSSETSVNV
jgi:hypothetical protein